MLHYNFFANTVKYELLFNDMCPIIQLKQTINFVMVLLSSKEAVTLYLYFAVVAARDVERFVCEDILRTDCRQGSDNDGCQVKGLAGCSDLGVYQGRFGR